MHMTRHNGVIGGFCDDDDAPSDSLENNPVYRKMKATPRSPDLGNVFLALPTGVATPDARTVYVVHEIRVSYGKTRRRVVGVYDTKRVAELKAAEVQHLIVRFLEQYNGRPFEDDMCGGTLVHYWHAGNPLTIVGFKTWVEEARLFPTAPY